MKHAVPNQWMEGTLFSQVHFTAQLLFQIDKQSPWEPRRRTRASVDQQIQVAILAGIAPRKGTEHTHTPNAMPGRDGEDRVTFA